MKPTPTGTRHHRLFRNERRPVRALITVLSMILTSLVVITATATTASAAGSVSPTIDPVAGFPTWYEDSAGNRVEPCNDPTDANCVLAASEFFDPSQPVVFPTNYPDEFFYALADSGIVATQGCAGTAPGRASVRVALEGAFINGAPVAGDQMVFGRIRVKVTSGLCPNTTYRFRHPFGTEVFTTNAAGAVPANVGTQDIGCVPAATVPCDFTKANNGRVFGSAAGGFLRWDPAVAPAAPAGYLGDGATPHTISGGTAGNDFAILDSNGNAIVDDAGAPLQSTQFTVAGKLAGSLTASPAPADFGGQDIGTTGAAKTITVKNLDKAAVTIPAGGITLAGADAAMFGSPATTSTCVPGKILARDQTCTVVLSFSPTGPGRREATLQVASTGGVRSPLAVRLTGSGTNVGAAPHITLASTDAANPGQLAFGDVRVRTVGTKTLRIGNQTGTAPLRIDSVDVDPANSETTHYKISSDQCSGRFLDPGLTCDVTVQFTPSVVGAHDTQLVIRTNDSGSPHFFPITGTGTGGVAAVSSQINDDGFADWYRDENGVKVEQCIDPADPYCIVFADATFDPAQPLSFPTNFPGEFFYQVATSDNIATPGCAGSNPGRAFVRTALEGAFGNGDPAPGDQIVFGRIRLVVTGGLCPNTTYTFTHPYGQTDFTTNAAGAIARNAGTEDVGCFPVAPDTCDFTLPLSSRVMAGLVRWDPAVAPAAPAGYLGDAATLHSVVGAPFQVDGAPANYFRIAQTDGTIVGQTNDFTVMGKLRGPLETSAGTLALDPTPVGSTSGAKSVTLTNTGISPVTVSAVQVGGTDLADFTANATNCVGRTLAVGATCQLSATFSPGAVGDRSATLTVRHNGLNDPLVINLTGIGGVVGSAAAISFQPRTVAFTPQHLGSTSKLWTVTISNAGGTLPLAIHSVTLGGTNADSFAVLDNRCPIEVDAGASCQVDVAFSPLTAGALSGTLVVDDSASGGQHSLPLTGTGSNANPAVSASVDSANGFPQWYADGTGVRLSTCLNPADPNCVVLPDATFTTTKPVSFPSNFPSEFFYALADSEAISLPGCNGSAAGTALMRVALEGSFTGGTPAAGQQITFGRLRISATGGLCPGAQYLFVTPYGPVPFTANAAGGIARTVGTEDIGCGPVAPATCAFGDALASRIAQSFPRWDPAAAPAAPAGYLGVPGTLHPITGGTYVPAGASQPVNYTEITDLAGNSIGRTDKFLVSGKVAGPLQSDLASVDFLHSQVGQISGDRTITATNVAGSPTTVSGVSLTGVNASEFRLSAGGTCAGAVVAADATCQVKVAFAPTAVGVKNATLRVTPATGDPILVALTATADQAAAPVASITPGVLAYVTVTAPSTLSLSTVLRNTGNAPLVVGAPAITGAAASDFSVTTAPCGTIAPGGLCTVTVQFKPTAIGSRTATLTLPHNAVGGSVSVSLTGTGAGSQFTLAPSPVKFGTVNRGKTGASTISIKNSGTIAFRLSSAAVTGAPAGVFTVLNNGTGCIGTTLAAGKSCNITVNFAPAAAASYTGVLDVVGDSTSLPAKVSASLTGTGK